MTDPALPNLQPNGPSEIRLLIVNWTRRKVGGTEEYLASILPELQTRGYHLAFVSEVDFQIDRGPIELPVGVSEWCVALLGEEATLESVKQWKPNLIYAHGELNVGFERRLLQIAPAIYFAHNYYGTCISGYKAHKWPIPRPCNRTLGLPCLLNYLPLRCGGLSPVTMLRRYRNERNRLDNLRLYSGIVTHSDHMRNEYINHGFPPARVFNFAYEAGTGKRATELSSRLVSIAPGNTRPIRPEPKPHRLLFLGRMEKLKGGRTLVDAVPLVQAVLQTQIQATFGGDGPERKSWQLRARKTQDHYPGTSFAFTGWLTKEQVSWQLENTDVMVVPSLWPEPFGRVGIQAGQHGIPVAAFAVGGIPEWLKDGVNGRLAPGDPPTAAGLAAAIVKCLNIDSGARLRASCRELANRFSTESHVDRLADVFNNTLASTVGTEPIEGN